MKVHPDSVLFITLDSCRFDTFLDSNAPNIKSVAPVHRAIAPSHFTYGSHSAMFVGFTPSLPGCKKKFLDNKYAKLFKLQGGGLLIEKPEFDLSGENIIIGFRRLGYLTIGSGAVGWFNPDTETGQHLTSDFEHFLYSGLGVEKQLQWMLPRIHEEGDNRPLFCFINIGETHVPYWHSGANWSNTENPCIPYSHDNRAEICQQRQRLCCEYVDSIIKDLIEPFTEATIVICADHGDCWGEDNLWEHGVSHAMTLTVPLLLRVRGKPID